MNRNYQIWKKLRFFCANRNKEDFLNLLNTGEDCGSGFISGSIKNGWYDIAEKLIDEYQIEISDLEFAIYDLLLEAHYNKDPKISSLLYKMAIHPKIDPNTLNNILFEQAISNKDAKILNALISNPNMKWDTLENLKCPNLLENINKLVGITKEKK